MIYNKFILKLIGTNNIDFGFCLSDKLKNELCGYNEDNILNIIAFSPISFTDKEKIFDLIKKGSDISLLKNNLEEKYIDFEKNDFSNEMLISKYTKFLFDWIIILSQDLKLDLYTSVKNIKKNLDSNKEDFWFYFIKCFFDGQYYKETIFLISFIKKDIIKKNSLFYNRLTLYEVISLRDKYEYLEDEKKMKKLCRKSRELKNFSYLKIITLLECLLLSNKLEEFTLNIEKFSQDITNWQITEILNLFEIVIYSENEKAFNIINNILKIRDIKSYQGNKEFLIYQFLMLITKKNISEITKAKNELQNYDFSHFDWYKKKKQLV